jgi:hypothetical protein
MTTSRGILAKSLSGRGCFFAGRRCKILVMMGIAAAFAPIRQKTAPEKTMN